MPSTPFIGVRISWLMLARNWLFSFVASRAVASAFTSSTFLASTSSFFFFSSSAYWASLVSASFRSVISRTMTTTSFQCSGITRASKCLTFEPVQASERIIEYSMEIS